LRGRATRELRRRAWVRGSIDAHWCWAASTTRSAAAAADGGLMEAAVARAEVLEVCDWCWRLHR
jgi:hypothetical protein